MIITLKFGIPYSDILSRSKLSIEINNEKTIRNMMEFFLESNDDFKKQVEDRGYLVNGELKAIYTKNGRLVSYNEELNDGDVIEVIVPIVGG